MKIKTSELTGPALDWAVAKAEGFTNLRKSPHKFAGNCSWIMNSPSLEYTEWLSDYSYSTSWEEAGPIIEREKIKIAPTQYCEEAWYACLGYWFCYYGNTPLDAAMRCYVASKLGDEIEVPEELI